MPAASVHFSLKRPSRAARNRDPPVPFAEFEVRSLPVGVFDAMY